MPKVHKQLLLVVAILTVGPMDGSIFSSTTCNELISGLTFHTNNTNYSYYSTKTFFLINEQYRKKFGLIGIQGVWLKYTFGCLCCCKRNENRNSTGFGSAFSLIHARLIISPISNHVYIITTYTNDVSFPILREKGFCPLMCE